MTWQSRLLRAILAKLSLTALMENSPSGLWRTLGKRVGFTPSRVRISYSPLVGFPRLSWKPFSLLNYKTPSFQTVFSLTLHQLLPQIECCAKTRPLNNTRDTQNKAVVHNSPDFLFSYRLYLYISAIGVHDEYTCFPSHFNYYSRL